MPTRIPPAVLYAIESVTNGEHLLALTVLADFYDEPGKAEECPEGLSWYGLSLATVSHNYELAIERCCEAIARQPERAPHYLNLVKIHLLLGDRKEAVETLDRGLKVQPDDAALQEMRQRLGIRARPPIPQLERSHSVNVALGKMRQAVKKKKKKPTRKK